MKEQGKNQVKILSVLIFVFVLGGVTGAAINNILHSRPATEAPPSLRSGDAYFETLQRELELSQDQASQLHAILDETRSQYKSVCSEVRPRYDALREVARARMRVLLSPDQQKRFDLIVTREDCQCPEQKSK